MQHHVDANQDAYNTMLMIDERPEPLPLAITKQSFGCCHTELAYFCMMMPLREYPTFGRVATWDEWRDATAQSLHDYMLPWFISNMVGFVLLWISIQAPRVARKVWGLLMILASLANTRVVMTDQQNYHEYGVLSIPPYQHFIYSTYFVNPALLVFPIAVCQNMIGWVLMLSEERRRLHGD
jgi:hypothetical protein